MNKQLGIIAIAIFSVMMLSMVSAAVTLTSPTASSYLSGTTTFTCTKAVGDAPLNATNATLQYTQAAAWTQLTLSHNGNSTVDDTSFSTAGVSIAGLTDGVYNFSCHLWNATAEANSSVILATVDNTDPTLTIADTTVFRNDPISYKCSDTNINTFTVSDGTTTTTLLKSTSDYTQFIPVAAGTYTFTCTDLASNSATETVTVSSPEGNAIPPTAITQKEIDFQNLMKNPFLWIIIAVIGLVWYSNRK